MALSGGKLLRILIVDDDELSLELLVSILEEYGDLLAARDGEEGWSLFCEAAPALVFLDMQLPSLDGYALARRMKEARPETVIVGVTAHALPGDRERVLAAGCDYYLAKPLDLPEVRRLVSRGKQPDT